MGNTRSVLNAFNLLGEKCIITNKRSDIIKSEVIVLPGVGAFSEGMANIKQNGLFEILNEEVIDKKKPYLGICLGLEFLAKNSLEGGFCEGLGWLDGEVRQIETSKDESKVPHMGWNDTNVILNDGIYSGIKEPSFYYLHSYYLYLKNKDKQYISGECSYGNSKITSSIEKNNIFAVQFHPEKSQSVGIRLLQNFLIRVRENVKE
jgi:imidazole glycerol-phosphate synthase subunit HisH